MDIVITLVVLYPDKFEDYAKKILESNLPKFTKHDLIDLLKTAVEQTQQAKNMGWL